MEKFEGVQDTLFIPLAGRVLASKNFKEFFYDEKALELEKYIPSDSIKENTDEYFTIASISRFYEFDNMVKDFIKKHGEVNIICLGAGLETMFYRIKNDNAYFYEIDFLDVIKQRELVLGSSGHEILIGSDILDFTWMDKIDKSRPSLIIASGVFQYMHRKDIIRLIKEIKSKFNNVEIAFDATNKTGIKKAEEYVKKTGNNEAMMYFYCDDIENFAKECDSELINVVPFYKNCTKILKKKLKFSTKFLCYFGDRLGFTKIIHLKIN